MPGVGETETRASCWGHEGSVKELRRWQARNEAVWGKAGREKDKKMGARRETV